MRNKIFCLFFIIISAFFASCSTGLPSPSVDVVQAKEEAQSIKEKAILKDKIVNDYFTKLGNKLVKAIPPEKRIAEFEWKFVIINVNQDNAFSLGGGYTYIFRDMLQDKCKNEGQLAGVVAHEIAHSLLRHTVMGEPTDEENKRMELDADLLGAVIMANAGYDPEDMALFFLQTAKEMQKIGATSGPTYPSMFTRAKQVRELRAKLKLSKNPTRHNPEFAKVKKRLKTLPVYTGFLPK